MASRRPTHNFVTSPSGLLYPEVTDDDTNDRTDITFDIAPATSDGWVLTTEGGAVVWAPGGGGGGGGVESISKSGDTPLTGDVTLSEGDGITLTQSGQDIEIASAGGGVYTLIDTITRGSNGAIDFQSIPGTYTDLLIVATIRSHQNATQVVGAVQINNDTGNNYGYQYSLGSATTPDAGASNSVAAAGYARINAATADSNHFSHWRIEILNYTSTSFYKDIFHEFSALPGSGATTNYRAGVAGGMWRSTSAITRVALYDFTAGSSTWATGSTARLYGRT